MTKVTMTRERCVLCNGTGAANPWAEHSMDWRDYLPCMLCRGTGYRLSTLPDPTPTPSSEPAP